MLAYAYSQQCAVQLLESRDERIINALNFLVGSLALRAVFCLLNPSHKVKCQFPHSTKANKAWCSEV